MAENAWLPLVEVGVAVIRQGERILLVYNPRWGAFTLPMSKRRRWMNNPSAPAEAWEDAAARAAAECLGRTVFLKTLLIETKLQQSDREGNFAEYRFHVFEVDASLQPVSAPDISGEWLTVDEILDPQRRPLSLTVVEIIGDLRSQGKL